METIKSLITSGNINLNEIFIGILISILLIAVGIFFGKIIALGLKKLFKKIEIEKSIKPSFANLIIAVIKWSIYIIFLNLALIQLPIPEMTGIITKILIVIPAFTAALVLISIGFGVAVYLRDVIEESEITGWKFLSQYLFHFIVYITGIYALKISLISMDSLPESIILVAFSVIYGTGVGFFVYKKEFQRNYSGKNFN